MTLSNFSCLIGTETFSLFDDALPLSTKIDIIGGRRKQIMKIQAFHKPISKAGVIDIFSSFFHFHILPRSEHFV
ncbi:MAG: hypothetical protein C00003105_01984 [ANME-2 cluster archaeon HR1]|nr:MAG: hypothetical protein C00003105_01984 [ANME-2 cluster archaeon HR1]